MALSIDELFGMVTMKIASPHTTITQNDIRKAVCVFLYFDEYLMDNVPEYCGDTEFGETDFGGYAGNILAQLELEGKK
jgi:hypothetical protein